MYICIYVYITELDTKSISISWKRASVLNDNTSFIYIISICILSLHSESTNNYCPEDNILLRGCIPLKIRPKQNS